MATSTAAMAASNIDQKRGKEPTVREKTLEQAYRAVKDAEEALTQRQREYEEVWNAVVNAYKPAGAKRERPPKASEASV